MLSDAEVAKFDYFYPVISFHSRRNSQRRGLDKGKTGGWNNYVNSQERVYKKIELYKTCEL